MVAGLSFALDFPRTLSLWYIEPMIYLAADHRGVSHKNGLKHYLEGGGYKVKDVGAYDFDEKDDYVDFAKAALKEIIKDPLSHKGIFLCGSGHGMDMVANKFKGIRAALGFNKDVAEQSREHEDANVLILAADWLQEVEVNTIARVWLETKFTGEERHVRRLKKIEEIEEKNFSAEGGSAPGGK